MILTLFHNTILDIFLAERLNILYSKNAKESPEKPYLGTRVKTGVNEKGQPGKIDYNKCLTIL